MTTAYATPGQAGLDVWRTAAQWGTTRPVRHLLDAPSRHGAIWMTEVAHPNLQKGMAAAGRTATGFERCVMKPCVIHRDAKYARLLARHAIALYATLPYYDIVLEPMGFIEATQAIRAARQRQDIPGMLNAVSEEMVDALVLAGTAADVHRQLEPWEGLCDLLLLYCPPHFADPAETRANHKAMIAAFAA